MYYFNLRFLLMCLTIILISFLSIAFFTLLDRKVLAYGKTRKGPNKLVFMGVVQPLLDGVKLFFKNTILPSSSSYSLVLLGAVLVFCCMVFSWVVVVSMLGGQSSFPFIMIVLFLAGLSVVGVFSVGVFSSSVYSMLGVLRSVAQMISYEVVMGLMLIMLVVFSFGLYVLNGVALVLFLIAIPLVLVVVVMEVNRTPVDFLEGESELVSGGVTELGGLGFALMFLGEYGFMSVYSVYLGSFVLGYFSFMVVFFGVFVLSWLRLSLPRFRYDLLMLVSWKILMPVVMALMLVVWGLI